MTPPASVVTATKKMSCRLTRLSRYMSGSLVVAVGRQQRVARGVRAGQHTDGAPPLHLQFGEVAFPPRAGEKRRIKPTQCQIHDQADVGVVTAEPLAQRVLGEWEGSEQAQRAGQRRPGI